MKISEILRTECIKVGLETATKQGVIEELVGLLPAARNNPETGIRLVKAVLKRETLCSTGIGNSVAIPHATVDSPGAVDLVFGTSREGIDFNSIDNKPVRIFFLIIAGADSGHFHLKILARIARLMHQRQNRHKLLECTTEEEVLNFLRTTEKTDIY